MAARGFWRALAVGYRLGSFRVEGEYFYRGTRYGSTDEPYFPDEMEPGDTPVILDAIQRWRRGCRR